MVVVICVWSKLFERISCLGQKLIFCLINPRYLCLIRFFILQCQSSNTIIVYSWNWTLGDRSKYFRSLHEPALSIHRKQWAVIKEQGRKVPFIISLPANYLIQFICRNWLLHTMIKLWIMKLKQQIPYL